MQKDLLDPAVKGTVNVLTAAKEAGVRRVVVTSSITAIVPSPNWPGDVPKKEECWTDVEFCKEKAVRKGFHFLNFVFVFVMCWGVKCLCVQQLWYPLSKTLAEKAAWDLAKESELDVVVVNPGMVLGPVIAPRLNASMLMLLHLLQGRDYFIIIILYFFIV